MFTPDVLCFQHEQVPIFLLRWPVKNNFVDAVLILFAAIQTLLAKCRLDFREILLNPGSASTEASIPIQDRAEVGAGMPFV